MKYLGMMEQFKKSVLPFIAVMLIVIYLLDLGEGTIEYELVSTDSIPDSMLQELLKNGPGGTGLFEYEGFTYAFILTKPEDKAEILSIEESKDGIGSEVTYKVAKNQLQNSYGGITVILLKEGAAVPFSFREI